MKFEDQVSEIVKYIKSGEKNIDDFKIGSEFEHLVIDKETLRTINYYEINGIESILKELMNKGWTKINNEINILALSKEYTTITLEPGGQIEISIKPHKYIKDIENEYLDFLKDIVPILEKNNQMLVSIGYHPISKIEDIPFIPKGRYEYMSNYFKSKGKRAINMMKGTCSAQIAIDYSSEEDYIKKFRVANALTTVIAIMFDNSPFFEGELYNGSGLRTDIWLNCDLDRCGVIHGVLDKKFGYSDYAQYILNNKPIIAKHNDEFIYTDDKLSKELIDPSNYDITDLEHIMTMFFPDVRTKKFIEIRMADALPYPLNMSILALWKGLLYDKNNLDDIYEYLLNVNNHDIEKSKKDILVNGFDSKLKNETIIEIMKYIVGISLKGLSDEEKEYMIPLINLIEMKKNPSQITKDKMKLGMHEAINWLTLNNFVKEEK